jgi:hypothetical protein
VLGEHARLKEQAVDDGRVIMGFRRRVFPGVVVASTITLPSHRDGAGRSRGHAGVRPDQKRHTATPSTVALAYANAQAAGDTNIIAVGWNDATSTITSVTDSAGNTYQLAAPVRRGPSVSQAMCYARNMRRWLQERTGHRSILERGAVPRRAHR